MSDKTTTYYVSPKIIEWDSLTVSGFPFAVGGMDGSVGLLRVYRTLEEFFAKMSVENGEWIIHGMEWDDPKRIRSYQELMHRINLNFLSFSHSNITLE